MVPLAPGDAVRSAAGGVAGDVGERVVAIVVDAAPGFLVSNSPVGLRVHTGDLDHFVSDRLPAHFELNMGTNAIDLKVVPVLVNEIDALVGGNPFLCHLDASLAVILTFFAFARCDSDAHFRLSAVAAKVAVK